VNLRERAHFAWLDRQIADEDALRRGTEGALRDLVCDACEIECTSMSPYLAPPEARFDVDGLEFKVVVDEKTRRAGDGRTWTDTVITVMVRLTSAYVAVRDLADLGRLIAAEAPAPTVAGEPKAPAPANGDPTHPTRRVSVNYGLGGNP